MQSRISRRSSLFLLELIIAILFFIIASTICVRLFVRSHMLEAESIDLNHAVNAASSVAELLHDDADALLGDNNSLMLFYDDTWQSCDASEAVYQLLLETTHENSFLAGHIDVTKGKDSIYSLDVKYFQPEGGQSE